MPAPSANVSASVRPGVIASVRVSAASAATETSIQLWEATAKRLRSTISAIEPITSASSTAGRLLAVCTSAISVGESDSAAITVTAPTVFIQITSCEPARAVQAARKPTRRSGATADSSAGGTFPGCRAVSVTAGSPNGGIMLVDGHSQRESGRGRDAQGRGPPGRRPPGHRIQSAQRGDADARKRRDRQARAEGGRGARLPAEPDRARAQDQPLVHDRRPDSGPDEPAVPADPAGNRGSLGDRRLHAAYSQHGQRSGARAARLADDARSAG